MNTTNTLAQVATREQAITLLAALNDKLAPMPAPKPETVPVSEVKQVMYVDPELSGLAEAVQGLERMAFDLHIEIARRAKRILNHAPARNAVAWQYVVEKSLKDLQLACDGVSLHGQHYHNQVRHITELLVLAADGTLDDLETGGHHEQ